MNDFVGTHPTITGLPEGDFISHPDGEPVEITDVTASQILDSRGWPTVEVSLTLNDGTVVVASAPAGASTGENEAAELRDGDAAYSGRGVRKAVAGVLDEMAPLLKSRAWAHIRELDDALRELDGNRNYSRLGANAAVAVSIAATRAFAHEAQLPVHEWIAKASGSTELLPVPHFNVLNGGAHAANDLEFQEFMIAPIGAANEELAVQTGAEVYHALSAIIRKKYGTTGLGDEGGFAPPISNPEEALDLLTQAIQDAGYTPGRDGVAIAMDPAANSFYEGDGAYRIAGKALSRQQLTDYYEEIIAKYPVWSIEDGFAEDDHEGWVLSFAQLGDRIQFVGDDLYVTDEARIRDGATNKWSNAALIKPNQIGTVSQTLDAIAAAKSVGMECMVSHRSGETLDTFVADLVVGTGVGQIKSGAPARGERVAKYNRLMQISALNPDLRYGLK
jgi:enolase